MNGNHAEAEQVTSNQTYILSDDLYKMLKFVRKKEFENPSAPYKQDRIIDAFTFLCKKVNVFDEVTKKFNLKQSEILQKIFNNTDSFGEDEIWVKLLQGKCKAC